MALIDNTTYTGKDAAGFYSTALLTGNTKEQIKLVPNVKDKIKMASMDLSNPVKAAGCAFSANGDVTLAQKTLTVCPMDINLELCTTDFETNYLSESIRPGSNNNELPANVAQYVVEQVMLHVSAQLEDLMWNGDTNGSPEDICDGFLTLFDADNAIVTVDNDTLSASNIISEMALVYNAIPATVFKKKTKGTLRWFISVAAEKFFKQAIAAASAETYYVKDTELVYLGIPLVVSEGLPDNIMVVADSENLWYGTDLVSDFEDIKIINMLETTGDRKVRMVGAFKFGVNYGVSEEIVYYRPAV